MKVKMLCESIDFCYLFNFHVENKIKMIEKSKNKHVHVKMLTIFVLSFGMFLSQKSIIAMIFSFFLNSIKSAKLYINHQSTFI